MERLKKFQIFTSIELKSQKSNGPPPASLPDSPPKLPRSPQSTGGWAPRPPGASRHPPRLRNAPKFLKGKKFPNLSLALPPRRVAAKTRTDFQIEAAAIETGNPKHPRLRGGLPSNWSSPKSFESKNNGGLLSHPFPPPRPLLNRSPTTPAPPLHPAPPSASSGPPCSGA